MSEFLDSKSAPGMQVPCGVSQRNRMSAGNVLARTLEAPLPAPPPPGRGRCSRGAREGLALDRALVNRHAQRRGDDRQRDRGEPHREIRAGEIERGAAGPGADERAELVAEKRDRKSTRLNSSHDQIPYAVFCLKKKIIAR